ncbi:hypothetical protein [Rhodococcus wratislaviensis]|uniref:hypothetical protein n=1 Tax=Rhodococcus wratislaviensis TaxID=44752 RepID=UPI00364F30EF
MANEPFDSDSNAGDQDESLGRVFELIRAVAHRDADVGDITSTLRNEGFDTLDVLMALLARAYRLPEDRISAQEPIDIRKLARPTPPELVAQMTYRPISTPFVLNGALYDIRHSRNP